MTIEDYTDPLFWKACKWSLGLAAIGSLTFLIYRGIDTGEWNFKKQNAIYYEFNKIKESQKENKKNYFAWADSAMNINENENYHMQFAKIRGELKKIKIDEPLLIKDFQEYVKNNKKN
jgi:hypothetical protein